MSADVPFDGLGLDIFNRRVQGVSWKDIADEFDLGTPSKARNVFTKLTNITDYKIKGPDLVKLAQGGLHETLTLSKKVKALKVAEEKANKALNVGKIKIDNMGKALRSAVNKDFDIWEMDMSMFTGPQQQFLKGYIKGSELGVPDMADIYKGLDLAQPKEVKAYMDALKLKGKTITSPVDHIASWDSMWTDTDLSVDVFQQSKAGKGYLKISQDTGMPIADVDRTVWNSLLKEENGDVWKAYKRKPTSDEGFNAVKKMVADQRKAGRTVKEIEELTGVPSDVVNGINAGTWKPPSPGSTSYYKPPAPPKPILDDIPTSAVQPDVSDFPTLSEPQMVANFTGVLDTEAKEAVRAYTGSGYHSINGHLRNGGGTAQRAKQVADMDRAMMPATRAFKTQRGMDRMGFNMGYLSDEDIMNMAGIQMRDPGFLSTSPHRAWSNEILLDIECPPGTRGYYVDNISLHSGEDEYLMARGTKIMITKVEKMGTGYGKRWKVSGRVIV